MDRAVRHVIAKQAGGRHRHRQRRRAAARRISDLRAAPDVRFRRRIETPPRPRLRRVPGTGGRSHARRFPKRSRMQNAPEAQAEIHYLDSSAIAAARSIASPRAAADAGAFAESFMTAPSPGIISTTMLNAHYDSQQSYLTALAREMRNEYLAIHRGGPAAADRCARPGDGSLHVLPRSFRRRTS